MIVLHSVYDYNVVTGLAGSLLIVLTRTACGAIIPIMLKFSCGTKGIRINSEINKTWEYGRKPERHTTIIR